MSQGERLCCLMFVDVADSTRLYERLGDNAALRAVEQCLHTVAQIAAGFEGRVVKTIGDELMLVFAKAEQGLLAACEMQQKLANQPPVAGIRLAVRIGAHWGPAIEENGDYFGDTVNVAARLTSLARAEQIIVSGEALAAMPEVLRPGVRALPTITLRGKQEAMPVMELIWHGDADLTLMAGRGIGATHQAALHLRHQGQQWVLDATRPILTLGRDKDNDIVIGDGRASRRHASIELRHDKVVLVDRSTNGTYVAGEAGGFVLHRGETVLSGRGHLSFGQVWAPQGVEDVGFEVVE